MSDKLKFFYKHYKIILVILILQLFISKNLTEIYLSLKNTLHNNGRWISTKTLLDKQVMGARSFIYSTHALSKSRLNLGAWHGFQEVIYHKKISPKEVNFDFLLTEGAYIIFIFNKDEKGYCGVRISNNKNFENIYFKASQKGKFLSKSKLEINKLFMQKWNHGKVSFEDDSLSLFINNRFIKSFKLPIIRQQLVGFRGSYKDVFIDNIYILGEKSRLLLKEDFRNRKNYFFIFSIILFVCGASAVFILFIQTMKKIISHKIIAQKIVFYVFILILSFALIHLQNYFSGRYITSKIINEYERTFCLKSWTKKTCNEIKNKYSASNFDTYRILFIGTSQTQGSGARHEEETFVRIVEKKLNKSKGRSTRYECINAAIHGSSAKNLYCLYKKKWIKLNPKLVIINLSINDYGLNVLSGYLKRFVALNKSKGIKTIFVLEAYSIECYPGPTPLHSEMLKVSGQYNIPTINLHKYLLDNFDSGFLWCDVVHLSSFGHELAGDYLYNKISKLAD